MKTILGVAGLPRSGSTLMMRMLHHGGMEVVANSTVGYEDERILLFPKHGMAVSPAQHGVFLEECEGKAVKLLDIQEYTPPMGRSYAFIFMRRDPVEQAKSTLKWLTKAMGFEVEDNETHFQRLVESIRVDTGRALKVCKGLGPTVPIRFEALIKRPELVAKRVAGWVEEQGFGKLDQEAMTAQVVSRSPECFLGLLEAMYL